jgi:hypothetical protein
VEVKMKWTVPSARDRRLLKKNVGNVCVLVFSWNYFNEY